MEKIICGWVGCVMPLRKFSVMYNYVSSGVMKAAFHDVHVRGTVEDKNINLSC